MRSILCCLPLAVLLLAPSRGEAGIMIFTSGPTVKRIGDVPGKALSVGYHYRYAGVFWVEFWTWDGSYCVYEDGRRPVRISEEQAAELLEREVKDLERPFVYKYPPGLLLLAGIFLLTVPFKLLNRSSDRRMRGLFTDEYYRRALGIIDRHEGAQQQALARWEESVRQAQLAGQPPPPRPAPPVFDIGFEEAVLSLIREGAARDDAERNLRAMLAHRAQQQEQREVET